MRNKELKEEKAVETGNIFKLKDKFSQPFGLDFTNEKGRKTYFDGLLWHRAWQVDGNGG